jgi:multidrug transporter EmrE-like cation transporter
VSNRHDRSVAYALILGSVLFATAAQAIMKAGVAGIDASDAFVLLAEALARPSVWVGVGLYAVSSALWLVVLSRVELAVAYPFGAANYVFVVLIAIALGEYVSPLRWLGVVVIVSGLLLVASGWEGEAAE